MLPPETALGGVVAGPRGKSAQPFCACERTEAESNTGRWGTVSFSCRGSNFALSRGRLVTMTGSQASRPYAIRYGTIDPLAIGYQNARHALGAYD